MNSPGFSYVSNWTPELVASAQASNDSMVSGVTASAPKNTEWLGPELYCNMNIDWLYNHLNWFCLEYTRLGHTMPLIPMINPWYPTGRSFANTVVPGTYWRGILELLIHQPNVSGAFIWHADMGAWDSSEEWYTETLDFISTYGLTLGSPF